MIQSVVQIPCAGGRFDIFIRICMLLCMIVQAVKAFHQVTFTISFNDKKPETLKSQRPFPLLFDFFKHLAL